MRKAFTLLGVVLVILILGLLACNNGNGVITGGFNGSDPILREFRIGNVLITTDGTYRVPLALENLLTFKLNEAVDPETFVDFIDIRITLQNLSTGGSAILDRADMLDNGSFYVLADKKTVEYRLFQYMDEFFYNGAKEKLASPGDPILVTVHNVTGKNHRGEWFSFKLDAFKIIFTASNEDNRVIAGGFKGSDPIVTEFRMGNVPVTAGGIYNVPLGEVNLLTFVLSEELDPVFFLDFLDIKITIYNKDTGATLILNRPGMLESGNFFVLGENKVLEYRLVHYMDRVWIGGVPVEPDFASPGDALDVTIQNITGKTRAGRWFSFKSDAFTVVYTSATP